ncbi:MAG: oligosaccharide flippase family protein [Bacteroidetes bacterium]|nr:oligosaccharide flippase family protein [Bacteroidota bacterium]
MGQLKTIKSYSKDTVVYGLGFGLQKFVGFLLLPLYTRALNPSDYGIIDTITAGLLLFTIIIQAGLTNASSLYFYKAGSEEEKGKLLFTLLVLRLLSVIPSLIISIFSRQISISLFDTDKYTWMVFISCMLIPISLLNDEQIWIFRFYRKPWRYNLGTVIKTVGNVFWGLLLVVFLRQGVWGVQMATFLSSFMVIIYTFFSFSRKRYVYKFSKYWAKTLLKFGAPFILSLAVSWVFSSADRYFLLHYQNTTEIGLYSIGYTFARPMQLINMAFGMSFLPFFMSLWEKESDTDKTATKKAAKGIWYMYLVLTCVLGLFLSIFIAQILPFVTTPQYIMGAAAVPLLIFSGIVRQSTDMNSPGIGLREKPLHYVWMTIVVSIVSLGMNFLLIPRISFLGASISNLVSNIVYFILAVTVSQHYFKYDLQIFRAGFYFLVNFALAAVFPIAELKFNIHFPILLKVSVYFIGLLLPFIFGVIKISDLRLIITAIKNRKNEIPA